MNSDAPPDSPKLDRTLVILFSILIVTLALLFVIAGLTWAVRSELIGGPTPTPTATQRAAIPPTPDFRATRFIQDALTKEAYEAVVGTVTPIAVQTQAQGVALLPIVGGPAVATPTMIPGALIPDSTHTPVQTPTSVEVLLPVISNPDQPPTPTAAIAVQNTPVSTDTPPPTVTATPTPLPTFTSTFTPEPTITPSPMAPTPTATPIILLNDLNAQVAKENGATVRVGPSAIYSVTSVIPNGLEVTLYGRTESGEWVYGCCIVDDEGDEEYFWARQADTPPTGNNLEDIVPTGEPSDDVRWLRVQSIDPTLTPMPSPTAIPAADYPLYRRDPSNQARVAQLPRPPITSSPGFPYQPGGNFQSPVVVANNNVLGTSTDAHMYSVHREGGNQLWREQLQGNAQQAAAIVGEYIYIVDDNGILYNSALHSGEKRWQVALDTTPVSGVNIADQYLFVSVQRGGEYLLLMREQEDGEQVSEFAAAGPRLQYPAIGDQLVYVANEHVWALDIFDNLTEVWGYEGIGNATTPPLYIRPGMRATAELYIADDNNRVFSLDANTGRELWVYQSDEQVTGMAADNERLFLSGSNFVKSISRRDHEDQWRELTDGLVLGGPIVGDGEILIITENGDISYRNAADGERIATVPPTDRFAAAGAVSGERIFVAGSAGMHAYQGGGQ